MHVAVVTVGDELLVGEVTNTNATWLCQRLAERGAAVRRVVTVPDDVADIAETVRTLHDRYDAVLVTGGLGPTHDDVTMAAVATAFDRDLAEHSDAVAWLDGDSGYDYDDLTEGTGHLPEGARFLPNPEGVAPGAVVEGVYVLPGVPGEMKAMFDAVADEFDGDVSHVETVEADEPESALVDRIATAQERFDVTIGSYPGETVRLKVRSTDPEAADAAADWLRERVTRQR
ncbi:MAG: competence/damage-inducible protein A [Halobacteriaceae archaeon]